MKKYSSNAILKANKDIHDKIGKVYDDINYYVKNKFENKNLSRDVEFISMKLTKQVDVLDLGCGTGFSGLLFLKKGYKVTGVDISSKILEVFRKKAKLIKLDKNLTLINEDIDSFIKSNNKKWGIVIISSVLHHIPDYKKTLEKIDSMLENNGIVYITHEPLAIKELPKNKQLSTITNTFIRCFDVLFSKLIAKPNIEVDYSISDHKWFEGGISIHDISSNFRKANIQLIKLRIYNLRRTSIISYIDNKYLSYLRKNIFPITLFSAIYCKNC
jgi:ubiquinone/menaquinone biosynthesis C-methylase UbiE